MQYSERINRDAAARLKCLVLLVLTSMAINGFGQADDRTIVFLKHSMTIPASVKAELIDTLNQGESWRFVIGNDTLVMFTRNYFYEPPQSSAWACGHGNESWSFREGYGPGFCIPEFHALPALGYPDDSTLIKRQPGVTEYNKHEVLSLLDAKTVLLTDLEKNNAPYEFEMAAFGEMYKIVATYEASTFKQDTITFLADYKDHFVRLDYDYKRHFTYGAYSGQCIYFRGTISDVSTLAILNEMLRTFVFTIDESVHVNKRTW